MLAKHRYQCSCHHWQNAIVAPRRLLTQHWQPAPELNVVLATKIVATSAATVQLASAETALLTAIFPVNYPYSIAQLLDKTYSPTAHTAR